MTDSILSGFCRDCLAVQAQGGRRCDVCGSPRVLAHAELDSLSIAHLDCDAFYAAVEKRDRPDLADKPLIIGGGTRGVVLTACYNARIFGVRSAMPMFKALKLCPHATIIRPDMERYASVGRAVREMMRGVTPSVEPLSIDEAFLDLSGTERLHRQSPAMTLAKLASRIEAELGITVSVGLSHNKFLAKLASEMEKPKGFSIIGRAETIAFLREKPIAAIWGVGAVTAQRLERDGLTRIGQLQAMDQVELMKRYGVFGQKLYRLSRGLDGRSVQSSADAKSISAETTFSADLHSREALLPILRQLSEKVARRLKATDLAAKTIVLKLKTSDFKIRTRSRTLGQPTRLADRIFDAGRQMLDAELGVASFRLIGIGISEFEAASLADPDDLVDRSAGRRAKAEAAIDRLRDRFGLAAIETGYTFRPSNERAEDAAQRAARPREITLPAGTPDERSSGRSS